MIQFIFITTGLLTLTSAYCTRQQLASAVESYLSAQLHGKPSILTPHLDNSTWLGYYENNIHLPLNASILNQPLAITHNRSLYDTTACATYTEVIVNSSTRPHVIGTQLRFTNHQINKLDSVITKPGDWLFNITGYAYHSPRENWGPIPEPQRDTRATLKAAADAYCDVFSNPNVTVPWGTPCVRLEGGLYGDEGPNGSCAGFIPTAVPLTRRRYVVDEVVGAVDVMMEFGRSGWPDSHEFRVEGGRLSHERRSAPWQNMSPREVLPTYRSYN
ncbi:hypothetical protein LEMA_P090030.1 [Plenodomus lingam JN3]|uniref:DUF8021 domain-containing protein n=1 Tax=Leptosphaeria maculans (strain JN3 / isolate v23.1.3 / race Av1-4-5-6-7-8) TaxID=985895 RepID=E5A2F9_LEPMJ|nr:hypothetical protein LEMA_P090030.1 [Plenodomus lingam JN3]CBX97594.1 hypothetical protein LEMA_P090030.1 [Plenodomus lingam JN3]